MQDTPTTEVIDKVEQSFEDEAFASAPRRRGRISSGRGRGSNGRGVLS